MAKNDVAVKETAGLPAVIDFGADAGAGFEDADSTAYAIPFLRILQSLSPQCKKSDPAYIKGAEEGDFFNTVTEKLYKGEDGVLVVPCHYAHKYNAWAPRNEGGGFRGTYSAADAARLPTTRNADNQDVLSDGSLLTDTREHYVLIVAADGTTEPALLALSGSQLKKSKKWMTLMQGIRIQGQIAPMFSQVYKITPTAESNDKGSWSGIKVEHHGPVTDIDVYQTAKQFRDMVRSGSIQAAPADGLDEAPF